MQSATIINIIDAKFIVSSLTTKYKYKQFLALVFLSIEVEVLRIKMQIGFIRLIFSSVKLV